MSSSSPPRAFYKHFFSPISLEFWPHICLEWQMGESTGWLVNWFRYLFKDERGNNKTHNWIPLWITQILCLSAQKLSTCLFHLCSRYVCMCQREWKKSFMDTFLVIPSCYLVQVTLCLGMLNWSIVNCNPPQNQGRSTQYLWLVCLTLHVSFHKMIMFIALLVLTCVWSLTM